MRLSLKISCTKQKLSSHGLIMRFPPSSCGLTAGSSKTKIIETQLDFLLKQNRARLKQLLKQKEFSWKNLIVPLEDMEDQLNQFWSPIRHLHSVSDTKALRKTYHRCLSKLTKYHTELSHHKKLYQAIKAINDGDSLILLNADQQRVIKNELRDLKLAGVALPEADKKRFAVLVKEHAQYSTQFENHVLDATQHWFFHTMNEKILSGLPAHVVAFAKQKAKEKNLKGYVLTLDFPIYLAVMTYADHSELRQKMYRAFSTRASDQKPSSKKYDNSKTMSALLKLRFEMANLLGYQQYTDYSLQTKMAKSSKEVMFFLNQLTKKSLPFARREVKELEKFAGKKLKPWDINYYAEKLKHQKFDIDEEMLRPYFQEKIVLNGLFELVEKLFNIQIKEKQIQDKWHRDVKFFEIYQNKNVIGGFYTDLYAREGKRGGAWMDECQVRRQLSNGKIQLPIAFLTCNFSSPLKNKPSLLTHDEVITLFHEFGHCLHHLLTKVNYPEISGINGVEWDAVELPSQFMENFCWEWKVLEKISCHVETGEKLSHDLFEKLLASKHYHAGLAMLRQLQLALFDFEIHKNYKLHVSKNYIQHTLNAVRKKTSVFIVPNYNRFQHSFSHIFAGGYAAGYYSYKWAEVLSADAFSLFEENGIFNKKTGQSFLKNILEKGGSKNAMELFIAFRGRKPSINALLITVLIDRSHGGVLW